MHAAIPDGQYVKDDGGVSFAIRDGSFVFRGAAQPMRRPPLSSSGEATAFEITWEWGTPTFELLDDGTTLLENGIHRFRLRRPPTCASTEQMCHFRDAGYLLMPDCVPRAAIDAALRCAAVFDAVRRAAEGGSGAWIDGGGADGELLALAQYVWPTVCKILCGEGPEQAPPPTWAQVAVKAVDEGGGGGGGASGPSPGAGYGRTPAPSRPTRTLMACTLRTTASPPERSTTSRCSSASR